MLLATRHSSLLRREELLLWVRSSSLFLAQEYLALANKLIIKPNAVFVGAGFQADTGRPAQEAHPNGRLENVGRKWTAVDVELDAQVAGIGDPGDLIAGVEYDCLRDESNEYRAFGHFCFAALMI
jgi:hypothetical protein